MEHEPGEAQPNDLPVAPLLGPSELAAIVYDTISTSSFDAQAFAASDAGQQLDAYLRLCAVQGSLGTLMVSWERIIETSVGQYFDEVAYWTAVADELCAAIGGDGAFVWGVQRNVVREPSHLWLLAAGGPAGHVHLTESGERAGDLAPLLGERMPLDGANGRAALTLEPVLIADVTQAGRGTHELYSREYRALHRKAGLDVVSMISVPALERDGAVAHVVLDVYRESAAAAATSGRSRPATARRRRPESPSGAAHGPPTRSASQEPTADVTPGGAPKGRPRPSTACARSTRISSALLLADASSRSARLSETLPPPSSGGAVSAVGSAGGAGGRDGAAAAAGSPAADEQSDRSATPGWADELDAPLGAYDQWELTLARVLCPLAMSAYQAHVERKLDALMHEFAEKGVGSSSLVELERAMVHCLGRALGAESVSVLLADAGDDGAGGALGASAGGRCTTIPGAMQHHLQRRVSFGLRSPSLSAPSTASVDRLWVPSRAHWSVSVDSRSLACECARRSRKPEAFDMGWSPVAMVDDVTQAEGYEPSIDGASAPTRTLMSAPILSPRDGRLLAVLLVRNRRPAFSQEPDRDGAASALPWRSFPDEYMLSVFVHQCAALLEAEYVAHAARSTLAAQTTASERVVEASLAVSATLADDTMRIPQLSSLLIEQACQLLSCERAVLYLRTDGARAEGGAADASEGASPLTAALALGIGQDTDAESGTDSSPTPLFGGGGGGGGGGASEGGLSAKELEAEAAEARAFTGNQLRHLLDDAAGAAADEALRRSEQGEEVVAVAESARTAAATLTRTRTAESLQVPLSGATIPGACVLDRAAECVVDAPSHPKFDPWLDLLLGAGHVTRTLLAIPMVDVARDRCIGCLLAVNKTAAPEQDVADGAGARFDGGDVEVGTTFGALCALALLQAKAREAVGFRSRAFSLSSEL